MRWVDRVAGIVIRGGGLLVIVAVLGILVYLVAVVKPLFMDATMTEGATYPLVAPDEVGSVLFAETDEYGVLGVYALASGEAVTFAVETGRVLERRRLVPADPPITTHARVAPSGALALGFADGSIRLGSLRFTTRFLGGDEVTKELAAMPGGASVEHEGAIVERTPGGDLRHVALEWKIEEPLAGTSKAAPLLLDYRPTEDSSRLAVLDREGALVVHEVVRRSNMLTGETTSEVATLPVPYPGELRGMLPAFLLVTSKGDELYLGWRDGDLLRYDLRDPAHVAPVDAVDLVPEPGGRLVALQFMLGEQSLLAADSTGAVLSWFRVPRESADRGGALGPLPSVGGVVLPSVVGDDEVLVVAHRFAPHASRLSALGLSSRDKTFAVGDEGGEVVLHYLTSERRLVGRRVEPASPISHLQIAPKADGVFALSADGRAHAFRLSNPHPHTTLASLFGAVWYEGSSQPEYTWQSSSGTDDFEPKLSLVPLLFGTIKATLYSMLFAVPLALGAAIYTSEFLDRRDRAVIKPVIEVMASLPSVVLGFVAALVLAPVVERHVVGVLFALVLVPLAALTGGYVWQALPQPLTIRLAGRMQIVILLFVVAGAAAGVGLLESPLERQLFGGDFKGWLDGRAGSAVPGIASLAWAPLLLLLLAADRLLIVPALGRAMGSIPAARAAQVELGKFLVLVATSMVSAWAVGVAGDGLGLDPRGMLVGTYVQRNALVVSFVMGFAVIPIIYTIAEDALSTVPQTLRSGSLACGATRWQTATRVVLPVAASGIFAALMVGLGRAVGETMIVLMAAGNTPVMELNPFSGLRTLSANIAVELPEAAKDGTLYRTLFLAALTLFLLTFVVNTVAEVVRQRFRKRAYQL